MINIFILFIITHVGYGSHVTTQEFYTLEQCTYVKNQIINSNKVSIEFISCFQK